MDDRRFDHLSRALASGRSRRQVLKSLLGFGAATVAGGLGSGSANAARRPTPTPKPATCPGLQVSSGSGCVCPEGRSVCGPDCCDTPAACCDNACCPDGTVCIGEELCCPAEAMCGGVCCLNGRCFGGVCCDAAFVCGDTCCNAPGFQCCDSSCKQCCSDAHCASTEYCSVTGVCAPGCNEDSDCAHLSTGCIAGVCLDNACVAVDTCGHGSCCGSACLDCESESTFCLSSTCDPASSSCIRKSINDEQTCAEPGNLCVDYRCRLGQCTNVSLLICPSQTADGCAASACDPSTGDGGPVEPFAANGTPCPGGTCAGGVCCTGCNVDGVCYQEGDTEPGNLCNSCQPAFRRDGWFPVSCPTPPLDFCERMACNPESGTCSIAAVDDGEACPLFSTSQCLSGVCVAGRCTPQPAVDGTPCGTEESPNFCASGGTGTCQAGQCIAGAAHEGEQCDLDFSSVPACGSFVCRSGACTREAINNGIACTASSQEQLPCREDSGICAEGVCKRAPKPEDSICGGPRFSSDARCTVERCNAVGICSRGETRNCNFPSGSRCAGAIPIGCATDGSCLYTHGAPSFGTIACSGITGDPDDSRCCFGQVCILPPISGGGVHLGYGCWYPEDIPSF